MARSFSYDTDDAAKASNESLLLQHQHEAQVHHRSRPRSRCWSRWCKVFLVAVAFAVGCLEMIVLETILVHLDAVKDGSRPALLGELNRLVPEFSVKPVLFRKDPAATVTDDSERSRNETRDDWLSYMPRGNGFIAVNHTAKYTLPGPIHFKGKKAYSIAVFHQMHCLYILMDKFNDLTGSSREAPHDAGQNHSHGHGRRGLLNSHEHNHVNHCFRYLRQSLLCCGDTALEGQDPNTDTAATDGTGAVHMCKDYEAIRAWAEKRRLVEEKHP